MDNDFAVQFYDRLQKAKNDLEKKIERKDKLDKEIDELRNRVNVLELELKEILSDLGITPDKQKELFGEIRVKSLVSRTASLKHTIADAIYELFEREKRTMSLKQITDALVAQGLISSNTKFPESSVSTAIQRRRDLFESVGRGIWALKKHIQAYKLEHSLVQKNTNTVGATKIASEKNKTDEIEDNKKDVDKALSPGGSTHD